MEAQQADPKPRLSAGTAITVFISLAGVAFALTWLFLGMRAVMQVGGTCAQGGPYEIVRPCPKGIPLVMLSSIWGGLIFTGIYAWQAIKGGVPSLFGFIWPALFLSLGWNFFEFGFNPPEGSGIQYGWILPGVLFAFMGGIPLLIALRMLFKPKTAQPSVFGLAGSLRATVQGMSMLRRLRKMPITGMQAGPWFGTTPADATPSPPASGDLVAELERLDALHRSGSLTDEEYGKAKREILERQP